MMNAFTDAIGQINFFTFVIQKVNSNDKLEKMINWKKKMVCCTLCLIAAVVGFKCPTKVDSNSPSARFWPYPRYAIPGDNHHLITCVEGHPRLIACGEGSIFNENTLTCEELKK